MIKTEKFELEQRYVVLKITDVIKYLPVEMVNNLNSISRRISNARRKHDGKADLLSIVIEHDWPEYPWVLAMLKSRCEDNNASQYAVTQVAELSRLSAIEQVATALIQCKGRYHAELNTKALAEALGIELPYIGSIYEPELPLQAKMADILAIQLEEAKRGDPYDLGLYNGMLYMVAAHDGGEYKPVGKEDFYSQTGAPNPLLEQVILDVIRDGTAGILVSAEGIKPLSKEDMYIRPSAIELQHAEIGIPELVTELINPAQPI
jgi:hypothetical protein